MLDEHEWAAIDGLFDQLKRIADAVERISPPPPDRSKMVPAEVGALSRPTLADQAQWERDDETERQRIG